MKRPVAAMLALVLAGAGLLGRVQAGPRIVADETATPEVTATAVLTPTVTATEPPDPGPAPTGLPTEPPTSEPTLAPTAEPTVAGTGLPPVAPGLLLAPESQFAGGTVTAWGANFDCGGAGVALVWQGGTRLALTHDDPFQVVLRLPPSVPATSYVVQARCAAGGAGSSAAEASLLVRPAPPPPVAGIGLPEAAVTPGQLVAFQDRSTAGVVRHDWSFGDSSPLDHRATPDHVFGAAGRYTVTHTVWDAAGRASVASGSVLVEAAAALARYSVQSDGRTVAFLDRSQGPFTRVRWEFGDGATSDRRNTSHAYDRPGTYMPLLVASFPGPGGRWVHQATELGPLTIGNASRYNLALVGLDLLQVNVADETLAAGRRTVARVKVRREGPADMAGVRYDVRLRATRPDGGPVAGSPFLRRWLVAPAAAGERVDVAELELPEDWTQARRGAATDTEPAGAAEALTLTVSVQALNLREDNTLDNVLARPATFLATGALDLLVLDASAAAPAGAVDLRHLYRGLRALLPLGGADLRLWLPLGSRDLAWAGTADGADASLLAADQARRTADGSRPGLRGLVLAPGAAGLTNPCASGSTAGGRGLWVAAGLRPGAEGASASLRGLVYALSLQLGLPAAPGGESGGQLDPDYPVADGTLDGDGYDSADLSLRARAEHHDYRSALACASGRAWWSAYGYAGLVRRLAAGPTGELSSPAEPPPAAGDYAAIAGRIAPAGAPGERVTLAPIFHDAARRNIEDDAPGEGPWSLTLLDGASRPLFSRAFRLAGPDTAGQSEPLAFFQVLPWHPFTRRLVLREGGELRWSAEVPEAWPSVAVLAPAPAEAWEQGRAYTARWSAEDPAGRILAYQVDLSADDGRTWRPVGGTLSGQELRLETAYLPGCETCRLRVRASNGLLSSDAVSGPFRIAAPAPVVAILSPQDGAVLPATEPVWLEASAFDYTDGPLGPGQVAWLSNLDGSLGTAPVVQTLLSVGEHRLKLTAINSAGEVATAQVTLHVVPGRRDHVLWLPRLERH